MSSEVDFRTSFRTCSASETIIARNCSVHVQRIIRLHSTLCFSALDCIQIILAKKKIVFKQKSVIPYIVNSNCISRYVLPHLLGIYDRLLSHGKSELLHALDPRDIHIFDSCNSSLQLVFRLEAIVCCSYFSVLVGIAIIEV